MKNHTENWILSPQMGEIRVKYQSSEKRVEKPVLCSPDEVHRYLRSIWDLDTLELREEFIALYFNNARACLGWSKISIGGKSATIVEPSQVVAIALLCNASSVVVAHNHPSPTSKKPSTSDIQLTKRLYDGLRLLGLKLDDHIILTTSGFYSFRNANQAPFG
jgi:DNA repair protein RadC